MIDLRTHRPARRQILTRVSAAITLGATSLPAAAGLFPTGTPLDQTVSRAQPFIAINGGPAVTVETLRTDGTVIGRSSGSLLSSPDGLNRTVATAAHVWLNALAVDPNARVRVLTGTNYLSAPGELFSVAEVLLAPGADGTFNTRDVAALRLDRHVPNTGTFVIGSSSNGAIATVPGVGFRLTQSEFASGNIPPRDGNFSRWDGRVDVQPVILPDLFYNAVRFDQIFNPIPFNGGSTTGDSGAGVFNSETVQYSSEGRIMFGQFLGINVGWQGDRLSVRWDSIYADATEPVTRQFLMDAAAIPSPSALGLLVAGGLLAARRRRKRE